MKKKKIQKVFCLICVLVMINNILIVHSSGNIELGMELVSAFNRIPILTLSLGSETGQVGYIGTEQEGYIGPDSFAVEDGAIYVLDGVNKRIIVYKDSEFFDIDISACSRADHMKYQNRMIAVVDNGEGVTALYTSSGTLVKVISHPKQVKEELVVKITEIGESYLVWKTFDGNHYLYDWNSESMTLDNAEIEMYQSVSGGNTLYVNSEEIKVEWELDAENKIFNVLGVCENVLVYQQYEYVPNVDMIFAEMSVHRVKPDGTETYAIIDFSEWKAPAADPIYLSSDGRIYLMECLEDRVVISEILLGTTENSQMEELYAQAEKRRSDTSLIEVDSVNASNILQEIYNSSRKSAEERALEMINLEWTVETWHKDESINPDRITIPKCVLDASGDTKGIPYCWGGYNGLGNDNSISFKIASKQAGKVAGNIQDEYNGKLQDYVPNTIGIDCSGFVLSAYNMSGPKYGTGDLLTFGSEIGWNELKRMDFLVVAGHVVLYVSQSDGKLITYEAWSSSSGGVERGGKTEIRTDRSIADMKNAGYTCRTPFCVACNKFGDKQVTSTTHTITCSTCEYEWFTEEHDDTGDKVILTETHASTCSACGYVLQAEKHNTNGTITITSTTHADKCSDCGYVWPGKAHNRTGTKKITATTHADRCSVCNYVWTAVSHNQLGQIQIGIDTHTRTCSICGYGVLTEEHTYSGGKCSVCGVSQ